MTVQEQWQMAQSAAAKYEQYIAASFEPWATDLVRRAGLQAGWHVLDLACGTGVVARKAGPLLGANGSIIGSDLNEEMLALARRRGLNGPAVEWHRADAVDLPFESDQFDAVLCQQGLQFVPDKAAAVAEIHRVLRPGGVAAVSVWRSPEHNLYLAALADGLARHLSPEAGRSMLAPCGFGEPDELAALFTAARFASVSIDAVDMIREPIDAIEAVEANLAAVPMAAQIEAMEPGTRQTMLRDILDALDHQIVDGVLHRPMSANVAIAFADGTHSASG